MDPHIYTLAHECTLAAKSGGRALSLAAQAELRVMATLPHGRAAALIRREMDPLYGVHGAVDPDDFDRFCDAVAEHDPDMLREVDRFSPWGDLIAHVRKVQRRPATDLSMAGTLDRVANRLSEWMFGDESDDDDDD